MADEEWESTKGEGTVWNPTKEENGDPKPVGTKGTDKDVLDGYYVDVKYNVGENSQTLYSLKTKEGETFKVWGTKALNDEMENIRLGTYIRIKWHGKFLTKDGEKKTPAQRGTKDSFHQWEIFQNKNVEPMDMSHKTTQKAASTEKSSGSPTDNAKASGGDGIVKKNTAKQEHDLPF